VVLTSYFPNRCSHHPSLQTRKRRKEGRTPVKKGTPVMFPLVYYPPLHPNPAALSFVLTPLLHLITGQLLENINIGSRAAKHCPFSIRGVR